MTEFDDQLPPLEPLCNLQREVSSVYAEILSSLQLRELKANGDRADAIQIVLERLRHDALWAATEVKRSRAYKFIRQRYISSDVVALWVNARRSKDGKIILDALCKDAAGRSLNHEHVFEIQSRNKQMHSLSSENEIRNVLQSSISCVVTRSEHEILSRDDRLEKSAGRFEDGWARYIRSGIDVYDRLNRCWIVKRP